MQRAYRISKPRCAKGVAIHTATVDGFGGPNSSKNEAAFIAEACGARWSGRDRAYILPESKLRTFEALVKNGWCAGMFGDLYAPVDELRDNQLTYQQAKKIIQTT